MLKQAAASCHSLKLAYCNKKSFGFPVSGAEFSDIFLPMDNNHDIAEDVIRAARVIAVVGASPNPERPSNKVAEYLIQQGFDVIPVRPKVKEILGRPCYPSLEEIAGGVDVVDVFRKSEACPEIARAAVAIGAKALWLQEGVINEEAAGIAREGGLQVVMDSCIMKIHQEMNR